MGISVDQNIITQMEEHATSTFPDECCGFMFGGNDNGNIEVERISKVINTHPDFKGRRFLISPDDYMNAENYADENGFALVGVYHSHPNHPAIPSEIDRLAALPGFSYIIFSIMDGKPTDVTAWELAEDRSEFRAVQIKKEKE